MRVGEGGVRWWSGSRSECECECGGVRWWSGSRSESVSASGGGGVR